MKFCRISLIALSLVVLYLSAGPVRAADEYQVGEVKGLPEGLPEPIAALLDPAGYQIKGAKGVLCEIWLVKAAPVKADFKPTIFVKYPFQFGELMGAIRLPTAGAVADFRGQELPTGTFTLRYGLQPQDGNHLGTSDVRDFLLACSPELDSDPKIVSDTKELFKRSAKVAGSTHPAIFLLHPPPKQEPKGAVLRHNQDQDWWVLDVNANGKAGDKDVKVPLQIVVVGQSAA